MDNILQYVDKLFFYCLKKCKDRNDAEELSSQVILEVLTAIHNNRKIKDLESYIFSGTYFMIQILIFHLV